MPALPWTLRPDRGPFSQHLLPAWNCGFQSIPSQWASLMHAARQSSTLAAEFFWPLRTWVFSSTVQQPTRNVKTYDKQGAHVGQFKLISWRKPRWNRPKRQRSARGVLNSCNIGQNRMKMKPIHTADATLPDGHFALLGVFTRHAMYILPSGKDERDSSCIPG